VDEDVLQFRFDRDIDGPSFISRRVGEFLLGGLKLGGRTFEFLAYSQVKFSAMYVSLWS